MKRAGLSPVVRGCAQAMAIIGAIMGAASSAAQDAPVTSAAFGQCAVCHSIDGSNGAGPTLLHVIGRKSGGVPGFRYSRAMKSADILWDEATLERYLSNPQEFVPGNIMPSSGVADARERAEIIAYLRTLR